MSEEIRAWSEELARDPSSLVFLPLGEALRQRGQLDAAQRVVLAALKRHPNLADAHDLLGKVYADQYDFERAYDEWDIALQLAPEHAGAHKGLGFLYYRAGELDKAIPHLELASELAPDDASVTGALDLVHQLRAERAAAPSSAESDVAHAGGGHRPVVPAVEVDESEPSGFDPDQEDLLLSDGQGRALAGRLTSQDGRDLTDLAAGLLADVRSECERTTRLLEFGDWAGLTTETKARNSHVTRPTLDTALVVMREATVPTGRLVRHAELQAKVAAKWLADA